ncbi:hypothetical protein IFM89_002554 [Coptis chinensis]|uniref:FBD domain-containing protein n=1 Tax=Coptis chinensis TaxID=261450 RepID=A0A835HJE0_9MAGN|nr:hypothetical protein IFM89_002554 [Coptis chinensis]
MKAINISAPVLKRLVILDILEHKDSFHDCEIKVYAESLRVDKLLKAICDVKDLRLSDDSIETLSKAGLTENLLKFSNLKYVRLSVGVDLFNGEYLTELLHYLPNMECLFIDYGLGVCESEEDGVTDHVTPRDFLSNLKLVEVWEFSGSKNELCFLKLLLKNTRALETMTIISSSELLSDPDKQLEVTKQLLMVPKGSMHSVIDIS